MLFIDTIKGIIRERPPVWFMRQAGRVLPSYLELRKKHSFSELMQDPELAAEVTLLPVHDLGVDAAILFSDILVIPQALGMNLEFTDKGPVFSVPLNNNTAINNFLKTSPEPQKLDYIYKAINVIKIKKPSDIPLIGFCGAPFTTFCFMIQGNSFNHNFPEAIKLFYNDSKTTSTILEKVTELSIDYALSQAKHGIDTFQLFESHAGLIPADIYVEKVLPYVKRITSVLRDKGLPVIFFPKGIGQGISHINSDIADFVSIDWQFSLSDVRKTVDSNVGLQGNLDPRILSVENINIIIKELEKFLIFGAKNNNWIFNTGHGLSADNSFETVKFVVDWIKNSNWNRS